MQIRAPWLTRPETRAVMDALTKDGARAYFVGGCVRNTIIGMEASDVDIATDALPETVIALAEAASLKALPTGIDHGTITVVSGGIPYEVTSFRKDVETFGRHAVVAYSDRIEDDAVRRDFTMNAIYADAEGWVVDPLDGLDDLLARHVRFIENAHERIAEDYLRILRFFRFHAWYGDPEKGPDPEGLAACADAAANLAQLSRERVGGEFRKLLMASDPRQSLRCMDETGVLQAALPGARFDTAEKLIGLELKHEGTPDWVRRLVALEGADPVESLRMSRKDAVHLKHLHAGLESDMGLPELAYRFSGKVAEGVALLRSAAHGDPMQWDLHEQIERGLKARFPVAAADLMDMYSGKALGDNLKYLENKWIQSDFKLDKESLIDDL